MSSGEKQDKPGGDAEAADRASAEHGAPAGSEHHHELPAEEVPQFDQLDPEGRAEAQSW